MREPHHGVGGTHHRQLAERVWIARRAVLARIHALHLVATALNVMPATRPAAVMAGVEAALCVHLEAEGVAAALGEDFKGACLRMVSPHHAAFEINSGEIRRVKAGTGNATGSCAALCSV